ncbi:MAG TPA: hypothetical protein DIT10_11900 [Chryseobacterium sp.]|nr:hypothetical protein [Chryseobacterium sp.]
MTKKKFEITGVTLKTELKISLLFGVCFLFFWAVSIYFYYTFNHLESITHIPFYIFFCAMFLGFAWGLLIARVLGKKMRVKYLFEISDHHITTQTENKSLFYTFDYAGTELFSLVGTAENMRLFKIISGREKFKIRLGTYGLAPFSEKIDIKTMDNMLIELEPVLKNNGFTDKKVKTPNNIFEYRYIKY